MLAPPRRICLRDRASSQALVLELHSTWRLLPYTACGFKLLPNMSVSFHRILYKKNSSNMSWGTICFAWTRQLTALTGGVRHRLAWCPCTMSDSLRVLHQIHMGALFLQMAVYVQHCRWYCISCTAKVTCALVQYHSASCSRHYLLSRWLLL